MICKVEGETDLTVHVPILQVKKDLCRLLSGYMVVFASGNEPSSS